MAMASILGAAWTGATTAYNYNLSRFQFDAGQRQISCHQLQNSRIAMWNLFREDIRDLFGITTSNMNTYMVLATLFLGFVVEIILAGVKDFPEEPPWLFPLFCNSMICSLCFGVLSIWLAMHGTIAAHVASVKVLTQVVRPPIPNAKDVQAVAHNLERFEAAAPSTMFRIPNFFRWQDAMAEMQQPDLQSTQEGTPMQNMRPQNAAFVSGGNVVAEHAVQAYPTEDVGPSALLLDHVQLFRELQRTYLGFEAYSRVSLLVCAHQLLMSFAYFCLAHLFATRSTLTQSGRHAEVTAWICVVCVSFVSLLLFKLDLYVDKTTMRGLKLVMFSGPLIACMAVSCWSREVINLKNQKSNPTLRMVTHIFVVVSYLVHLGFEALIQWAARPHGDASLPISFRSVQYTDVFGWWYSCQSRQESALMLHEGDSPSSGDDQSIDDHTAGTNQAARQLRKLSRMISTISSSSASDTLTPEQMNSLSDLRETLDTCFEELQVGVRSRAPSVDSTPPKATEGSFHASDSDVGSPRYRPWQQVWLECSHRSDSGQFVPYFLHLRTGNVHWDPPAVGNIVSLPLIASTIQQLSDFSKLEQCSEQGDPTRLSCSQPSQPCPRDEEIQALETEPTDVQRISPQSSPTNLAPMRRRPDSKHESLSMAWKYFSQVGIMAVCMWAVTLFWMCVLGSFGFDARTGVTTSAHLASCEKQSGSGSMFSREAMPLVSKNELASSTSWSLSADRLDLAWPHRLFQPTALTCAGSTLVIGERFAVYATTSSSLPEGLSQDQHYTTAVVSPDMPSPWRALGMNAGGAHLFLVEAGGKAVLQKPLAGGAGGDDDSSVRRWALGPGADFSLKAITIFAGDLASSLCAVLGVASTEWALYATTSAGEIVSLCPFREGQLAPVHATAIESNVDLLGIASNDGGALWLLTNSSSGTELRRLSSDRTRDGVWELPASRHWAMGLCSLQGDDGFLAAASSEPGLLPSPELWHFKISKNGLAEAPLMVL